MAIRDRSTPGWKQWVIVFTRHADTGDPCTERCTARLRRGRSFQDEHYRPLTDEQAARNLLAVRAFARAEARGSEYKNGKYAKNPRPGTLDGYAR